MQRGKGPGLGLLLLVRLVKVVDRQRGGAEAGGHGQAGGQGDESADG